MVTVIKAVAVAAEKPPAAFCVAVIVAVPAPIIVTVDPLMVATVASLLVYIIAPADVLVAAMLNDASP